MNGCVGFAVSASRIRRSGAALIFLLLAAGNVLAQAQPQAAPPTTCPDSLPALFARVSPSVVSIAAVTVNPYDPDHRLQRVIGSGVIIDASGLILSNSHVVFGRQALTVTLDQGTSLPAKLVGADPTFDIAVVRIPTPSSGTLPVATLGDSSQLSVGEEVFAIGNPLGLDQTLTRGIVSAMNRLLPGGGWSLTEPLIQTDAAINPGNSGGPLVDPCGRVVGITTAILPEAQNIGFAVPINLVRDVVPQLVRNGRIIRPWLGVQGQFVLPELKQLLRIPIADGFLVEAIEPGSPAEQKGVQGGSFEITVDGAPILLGGDIITHVNGTELDEPSKLMAILKDFRVGTVVKLTLVRDGTPQKVDLVLTERPLQPWDLPGSRTINPGAVTPGSSSGTRPRRTLVF
jgi:serine protease Do